MSKEAGEKNRELFAGWIAEMKAKESPNWVDYFYADKLSPKKIADELGFGSDAFKAKRNPLLHEMLENLKFELAQMGVYHNRIPRLKKEEVDVTLPSENDEDIKDSAKVRDLKRANRRLQAENAKLSAEVAKLSEFKEVLEEMGLWK